MAMKPLRELEVVRALRPAPEVRDAEVTDPDVLGELEVRFSIFNAWYPIRSWWEGDFMERVAPGAFTKTIKERRNQIVTAFDHGYDPVIGDKVLGPVRELFEDSDSPVGLVDLLDTSYNRDLLPALKRGLYGSSFRMQVIKDEWNDEPERTEANPDGLPERTIKEVRLFEFGPVTYPANPEATASMRAISLTDSYFDRLRKRDPERVDALRSRVLQLRTPVPASASAEAEAASISTDEPRSAHSDGSGQAHYRARLLSLIEKGALQS